jgi:hypothetical protein
MRCIVTGGLRRQHKTHLRLVFEIRPRMAGEPAVSGRPDTDMLNVAMPLSATGQ